MTHKTKGIVLRSIKYGETSLIVTVFTELFGLQSYLVNGVRVTPKKGSAKAPLFQPAALLDLVAYQSSFKNLQRLKEYKWDHLYHNIFFDVHKNAVALFMMELLGKCLKQPESHPDLFYFTEDALCHLDVADSRVAANFPLFFALHLPVFFGFKISSTYSETNNYLDLEEGRFVSQPPQHTHYLQDAEAAAVSDILKMMLPQELEQLELNQEIRRRITYGLEQYYGAHVPEFGALKTLPVLKEIMGG